MQTINALVQQAEKSSKPLRKYKVCPDTGWKTGRVQDSQRQKVYNAEHRTLGKYNTRLTATEAQRFLKRIIGSAYVQRHYGVQSPVLEISGRLKRRSYARGTKLIRLAPHMVDTVTIVHELAHTYTIRLDPGHDWLFCAVYLDLLRKFVSPEAAKALKAEFKRTKVRHAAPRPKRQMSAAQKQAARDRMAKARAARGITSVEPHYFAIRDHERYGGGPWRLLKGITVYDIKVTRYQDEALTRKSAEGIDKMLDKLRRETGQWHEFKAVPDSEVFWSDRWGTLTLSEGWTP